MIGRSVAVFDRIRGHARIRHRLGIPNPNVVLAYEWQVTRARSHPYLILQRICAIFFPLHEVQYPTCIMSFCVG